MYPEELRTISLAGYWYLRIAVPVIPTSYFSFARFTARWGLTNSKASLGEVAKRRRVAIAQENVFVRVFWNH
jgi:hypothetical protein